ncbi:hypothetical protein YC2023_110650 [Brassica napus]
MLTTKKCVDIFFPRSDVHKVVTIDALNMDFSFRSRNESIIMSELCGPVVVDGPWMQTHSWFDPPAAETKSHCSAHHGCGYVRMKIRERTCRGLHLSSGG